MEPMKPGPGISLPVIAKRAVLTDTLRKKLLFFIESCGNIARMNIQDAMTKSGLGYSMLVREAAKGSFEADLPRGRRGGWVIEPRSFDCWLLRRKMKTGNAPARAAARRALEEMGGG